MIQQHSEHRLATLAENLLYTLCSEGTRTARYKDMTRVYVHATYATVSWTLAALRSSDVDLSSTPGGTLRQTRTERTAVAESSWRSVKKSQLQKY